MRKRALPLWMVLILMALMVALLATCAFAGSPPATSTGCQSITVSANTEITVPDTGPAIAVQFTYTPSTPIAETPAPVATITETPADVGKKNAIATSPPTTNAVVMGIEKKATNIVDSSPGTKAIAGTETSTITTNIVISPPTAVALTGTEITTPTLRPPGASYTDMATTGDIRNSMIETATAITTSPPTATCGTREGLVKFENAPADYANMAAAMLVNETDGACLAHNTHGYITVRA